MSEDVSADVPNEEQNTPEKQAKGGAPLLNRNSVTHGLRMKLSSLPPKCGHIKRQASELVRAIEGALEARAIQVGPYEATVIAAVARHHRHAALCARWLRLGEDLSPADKLRFSAEVARASTEMVKLLERIGLHKGHDGQTFDVAAVIGTPCPTVGEDDRP